MRHNGNFSKKLLADAIAHGEPEGTIKAAGRLLVREAIHKSTGEAYKKFTQKNAEHICQRPPFLPDHKGAVKMSPGVYRLGFEEFLLNNDHHSGKYVHVRRCSLGYHLRVSRAP